jgi:hypothetical protein
MLHGQSSQSTSYASNAVETELTRLLEKNLAASGLGEIRSMVLVGAHSEMGETSQMRLRILHPHYVKKTVEGSVLNREFSYSVEKGTAQLTTGLKGFSDQQSVVKEVENEYMRRSFLLESAFLWNNRWNAESMVSLELKGSMQMYNDRPCKVITSQFPSGLVIQHFLTRQGREIARRTEFEMDGKTRHVTIEFADFRAIGRGHRPHSYTIINDFTDAPVQVEIDHYDLNAGLQKWMF